jgi:hypothetical protein
LEQFVLIQAEVIGIETKKAARMNRRGEAREVIGLQRLEVGDTDTNGFGNVLKGFVTR